MPSLDRGGVSAVVVVMVLAGRGGCGGVHCGASCPPPLPPPPLSLFCSHVVEPAPHRAACSQSAIDGGGGLLRPRAVTPAVVIITVGGESGRVLRRATDPPRLFVSSCEQMELLLSPHVEQVRRRRDTNVSLLNIAFSFLFCCRHCSHLLVLQICLLTALISAAVMGSARVFAQLSCFSVFGQESRSGFTRTTGVTIPTWLTFGSVQSLQGGHQPPKEAF